MQALMESYLVAGRRIEAVRIEARRSNLPVIVLLHEGLGSVAHWKDFPLRLAEATGAGVFVYSRYGHGFSDPLNAPRAVSYMHEEAQKVLPEVLRLAGIERPVLFGHSDGASIAIIYAGTFRGSAAALVLEAPHVFLEDITVSSIAKAGALYRETDLPKKLAQYHQNADSLFWAWNQIWLDPAFRAWNIESYLDRIHCPVLVLQGDRDEYGTVKQIEAIQRRIPGASAVILEGSNHAPHREQPQAALSAVAHFIRTLQQSAAPQPRVK